MPGFVFLHIKTMVGDDNQCFIGSHNLDPRAMVINTKNGLYVRLPELARQLKKYLQQLAEPENAWQVRYGNNQ